LADLTDPLSIAQREAIFQHMRERSMENDLHGIGEHRVTGEQSRAARHGTLCCITGTVRGTSASCCAHRGRTGAIRQTLHCGAPTSRLRQVIENPAWSLRSNQRQ
jgi:hypothetical protein